ncbi:MAG: hypothetical protein IPG51_19190 [Chloroflexi bacterium]|nr:hypothetical protein [Chloroflexota bacterium]
METSSEYEDAFAAAAMYLGVSHAPIGTKLQIVGSVKYTTWVDMLQASCCTERPSAHRLAPL